MWVKGFAFSIHFFAFSNGREKTFYCPHSYFQTAAAANAAALALLLFLLLLLL